MRLRFRLPLLIVSFTILAAVGVGVAASYVSRDGLREAVESKLTALALTRATSLEEYLSAIVSDIKIVATDPTTAVAINDFQNGWNELGDGQTAKLQQLYIDDNPFPTGAKHELIAANDSSLYSQYHGIYHPRLKHFLEERGYYDIFLVGIDGNLVYTVYKELDYATNLITGNWADTGLGEAFRSARAAEDGQITFVDFAPYEPSFGAPASFISLPVFLEGEKIGAVVFQMPIDRINDVMRVDAGLGESGNSIIVGSDYLLRNDIQQTEQNDVLQTKFENSLVDAALNGQSGYTLIASPSGEIAAAYLPLHFQDTTWAIVTRQNASEALAASSRTLWLIALVATVILIVAAVGGFLASRQDSDRIGLMTATMRQMAQGDFDHTIPCLERRDEFGEMASALEIFLENSKERARLEEANKTRQKEIEALIASFDHSVRASLENFKSVVGSLNHSAHEISDATSATNLQIQSVATATEELTASVKEIAHSAVKSRDIVSNSVTRVETASNNVEQLAEKVAQIDGIVELISDIAEQTNLLALNATIESARAGDAGKGFAVVASEVKALASRTAQATDDINVRLEEIKTGSGAATAAVNEIAEVIKEVDHAAIAIAGAVEEQQAATAEIAGSALTATQQSDLVSSRVHGNNENSGPSVRQAAETVEMQAANLADEIAQFLGNVRAA